MFISILICTRNRADSLQKTLESIFDSTNLELPHWEIVVVDNNSDDHTSAVCGDFQRRFPKQFRFLVEKKLGHSNALNSAIAAATGDILAFTDDDVRCAPDYLTAIRTTFEQHPADGAQGRVFPEFEGTRPEWFDTQFGLTLALRDCGDQVTDLEGPLFGVNMIVRSEVFRKIGGFSPELGPGTAGLGADTEITRRMRQAGYRLIYAPQVLVWHRLPKERLTKSYFRKRFFTDGRSIAHYMPLPVSIPRFGLYLVKESILKGLASLWYSCAGRPTEALHCECDIRSQAGFFWQHLLFAFGFSSGASANMRARSGEDIGLQK